MVVPHDKKGPHAIQTSQQNPAITLVPYPWPKRTVAFDLALRQLQKSAVGKILPWDLKAEVKCLIKLGSKRTLRGFVRRPVLTYPNETLQCIQLGYANGGEFKLHHQSEVITDRVHTCYVPMTPEEAAEEPFHRFKWHR